MSFRSKNFEELVPLILRLPAGQHFDVDNSGGELSMQAEGEKVYELIRLFPEAGRWEKVSPDKTLCGWWGYRATMSSGLKLHIYADRIGPRTCRKIVEQVTEIVHVPTVPAAEEYDEERTVEKVRWECDPDPETD